jgi:hypothetical protein
MTTFEKSRALWIGGGLLGAVAGYVAFRLGKAGDYKTVAGGTAAGAVLGSILFGGIGDAVLEQEQRTGVVSLLPLRRR